MGWMWIVGAIAGWFTMAWIVGPALGLTENALRLGGAAGGGLPGNVENALDANYGAYYR